MVLDSHAEVYGLLTRDRGSAQCFLPMRRRLFLGFVGLLLTLPYQSVRGQQQPWLGTWNLNPAKSTYRYDSPYKRVTTRIEPWQDGLKVTYDMVGTRGGVTHLEWTGKLDGKDYPVQGVDDYILTNAYRPIDDRSYEIVVKKEGAVVATSRVAVSPDGKTLSVATEERGPNGQTLHTTAVYEKQ
jgi:hypothetical protein